MKKSIYVVLILLTSVLIFPQQKFRTGVYSQLSPTDDDKQNLKQVYEMGANTVINQVTNSNRDSLEALFDSVIVINAFHATDYVHHYSAGYYTKWEVENDISINVATPGIKHEFGTPGSSYWFSGINSSNIEKYLVTGPDYRQDRKYKQWYDTSTINYTVNFNMKIDGLLTYGLPVCEISVGYRTESGQFATLISQTYNANQLSNSFKNYILNYTIPEYINGSATQSVKNSISGGTEKYSERPMQTEDIGTYGVQFNIKWLGNRNLYVDYIEVYDQSIWGTYLDDPATANSQILNYAVSEATENTQYWYSLDEPHSIDNYEPYKVVENILTSHGYQPLITAFYPGWDGQRNHEWTIKRFLETVQPKKFMYDYYPYYYDKPGDPYPDEKCLEVQRNLMQIPFNYGFPINDYYYVAQAFGYTPQCSSDINYQSRKPNPAQLRASVMLALAHGAKGIFFWRYYLIKQEYQSAV